MKETLFFHLLTVNSLEYLLPCLHLDFALEVWLHKVCRGSVSVM